MGNPKILGGRVNSRILGRRNNPGSRAGGASRSPGILGVAELIQHITAPAVFEGEIPFFLTIIFGISANPGMCPCLGPSLWDLGQHRENPQPWKSPLGSPQRVGNRALTSPKGDFGKELLPGRRGFAG